MSASGKWLAPHPILADKPQAKMAAERLAAKYALTSTTPRSGRLRLESLVNEFGPTHELLYEEGKVAKQERRMDTAIHYFSQVPRSYKKTALYLKQCEEYKQLCGFGFVLRGETAELRREVALMLSHPPETETVGKCAEALYAKGFDGPSLRALTLWDLENVEGVFLSGQRALVEAYLASRSSFATRAFVYVDRAMKKCGGFDKCLSRTTDSVKRVKGLAEETAE
jgi:hypothetical protein